MGNIYVISKCFNVETSPFSSVKRLCLSVCLSLAALCLCLSASFCAAFCCGCWSVTYQSFVLDLLPDELVFTQGVAGLSSDGVDGALFHLLLDGAVQHEQRLPGTLLRTQTHRLSHDRTAPHRNKTLIRPKTGMHNRIFKLEMLIIRCKGQTYTREHLRLPACAACWTNLEEFVKEEGEPVCQHLLSNGLCSEMIENKSKTS